MKYLCILVSIYTNMKKIIVLLAFCLIACINAQSQKTEPVKWNTQINNTEKENFKEIVFSAHILGEWHLFGTQLPEGGPHSTAFVFDKIEYTIESLLDVGGRGGFIRKYTGNRSSDRRI